MNSRALNSSSRPPRVGTVRRIRRGRGKRPASGKSGRRADSTRDRGIGAPCRPRLAREVGPRTISTFSCDIGYSDSPTASRASRDRRNPSGRRFCGLAACRAPHGARPSEGRCRCDRSHEHEDDLVATRVDEPFRLHPPVVPHLSPSHRVLHDRLMPACDLPIGEVRSVPFDVRVAERRAPLTGSSPRKLPTSAERSPRSPATSPAQYPPAGLVCARGRLGGFLPPSRRS